MRHRLIVIARWTGRFLYFGLIAVGVGMTGNDVRLMEEITRYRHGRSREAETRLHPERIRDDVPPTETELALWSQFDTLA